MTQEFPDFYSGDPEIMSLITEAIQKKSFVMIHYKPKSNSRKTQNYIILPVRIQLVSSKGTLVLMLLAKQPSKGMRIVQFIFDKIYAVKLHDVEPEDSKEAGVTGLTVNSVNSRKSFKTWGHFSTKKGSDGESH